MEYKDYLRMKQELIESGRTFAHTNAGSIYIIKEEINKEQAPLYAKCWKKGI